MEKTEGRQLDKASAKGNLLGRLPPSLSGSKVFLDPVKLNLLYDAARALASTNDLDQLLAIIVAEVRRALLCDGVGVALYDAERDDFYWRIIQDQENLLSSARDEIRIPKGRGVGGWVFQTGQPALINDAASDPRIYRPVEIKSGFITRNMICVPLKTMERSLGVLYALNKVFGSFDQDDVEILLALSGNVALALENAEQYENLTKSYKELERLHLVKTKILNHLSHELKTPLAIIEASLKNMERRMKAEGIDSERFPFDRMLRNVGRLRTIEKQVGDIVGERDDDEPRELLALLEDLKDIIEVQQEDQPNLAEALTALACKIEQLLPGRIDEKEGILITEAFEQARLKAEKETGNRILDIRFLPPDPAIIKMQPQIMMSVIEGLVRNAVENTPDHGKIVIKGENRPSGYIITVTDFGVGIPEGDQPNIFEGFYPVRESNHYRSGSRYAFYAGGTGTDLLKIKIFAERFGFKISFQSRRCSCIPTIKDLCPGDITRCRCCKKIEDCFDMGGTEFAVEMPPDLVDTEQTDV